jgi:hypothetical protein
MSLRAIQLTLQPLVEPPPLLLPLSSEPEPVPPLPADAPVQDIHVPLPETRGAAPDEPTVVVLSFPQTSPHAQLQMRHAVRNAYATDGEAGLDRLLTGIVGTPQRPWPGRGTPFLQAPIYVLPSEDARYQLRELFLADRASMRDLARDVQSVVGGRAQVLAQQRLVASRVQVLSECRRYTGLADDRSAAGALDDDRRTIGLRGPHLRPLVDALVRIDAARRSVAGAREELQRALAGVRHQRGTWLSERFRDLDEEQARDSSTVLALTEEAVRRFPDPPAAAAAVRMIAERETQLAATVAAEARPLPILFRLWDKATAASAARAVPTGGTLADLQDVLSASPGFREAVWEVLNTTWSAAGASLRRLRESDLDVWDYPPLIAAAVRALAVPQGTVEWQAAQERIREQAERISALSALTTLAALAEVAVALTAPAPPVAAAVGTVALLLDAADWVASLWRRLEERDAFNSSLDPSAGFAAEPSFSGLLVGLVFLGIAGRSTVKAAVSP